MNYMKIIEEQMKKNGIVTTSFVREEGVPTVYLSRLVEEGVLERVARGIYITDNFSYDEWYLFQKQFSVPVYSHMAALYLHQLTDIIVEKREVTVYTGYNIHGFKNEGISVHYLKKPLYELGITEKKTIFGNLVRVYNLERTVCDLIRHRKEFPSEVFGEAIQRYMNNSEKDLNRLASYGDSFNILPKIQEVIEVVL